MRLETGQFSLFKNFHEGCVDGRGEGFCVFSDIAGISHADVAVSQRLFQLLPMLLYGTMNISRRF